MEKLLGSHDSDELDRPDLNKCPDCGCYFPQDNCPLCGKECPEDMRAGNRRAVKVNKKRRSGSGRVIFVEWYHSWWFIIVMMIFMPVIGIILLATSPHKKGIKITVIVIAVIYLLFSYFSMGSIIQKFKNIFDDPVDSSLSYEEYVEKCVEISPEEFYRSTDKYNGRFVTMTLTVKESFVDSYGYYDGAEYTTYYICTDGKGNEFDIMIRDCEKQPENYINGDVITIYGEGAGKPSLEDMNYEYHTAPCIYAAHIE